MASVVLVSGFTARIELEYVQATGPHDTTEMEDCSNENRQYPKRDKTRLRGGKGIRHRVTKWTEFAGVYFQRQLQK